MMKSFLKYTHADLHVACLPSPPALNIHCYLAGPSARIWGRFCCGQTSTESSTDVNYFTENFQDTKVLKPEMFGFPELKS